jgi:hypothetical protein
MRDRTLAAGYGAAASRARLWLVLVLLVLVAAPTCAQQAEPEGALKQAVKELKEKASKHPVRVIAEAQPADEGKLIEAAQKAGATEVQSLGSGLVVMVVTADQLDRVVGTGLVRSIQEDVPRGTY